jgi:hypothetical protein
MFLTAARLPQKKIFEDEFSFMGRQWATASTASDPAVNGMRPCFDFNEVI